MCGLYVEELPRTSTIMEQWLLYTNWRRTLARLNNMAASDTLLRDHSVLKWARYGSPRCRHFGFSIQVAFLDIRNCNLCLLSLSNPTNILFFSAWISELHRNQFRFLLSGEGWDARLFPFTVCSATYVHGIQLPSTFENFCQHLLYLNISFITFSMNELKNQTEMTIPVHEDHKIFKHLFLLVIDLWYVWSFSYSSAG